MLLDVVTAVSVRLPQGSGAPGLHAPTSWERAWSELIFGREAPASDAELVGIYQRAGASEAELADALRQGFERFLVYRQLARDTLSAAIESSLPRSVECLGPRCEEFFSEFVAIEGPRSHVLRDVAEEFVAFAAESWRRDPSLPAYLTQLARYELGRVALAASEDDGAPVEGQALGLDSRLLFSRASRLDRFDWALLPYVEQAAAQGGPTPGPQSYLTYRKADFSLAALELNPFTFQLVQSWRDGQSLQDGLRSTASDHQIPLDDSLLADVAQLLADLVERGVVLGARGP